MVSFESYLAAGLVFELVKVKLLEHLKVSLSLVMGRDLLLLKVR